MAVKYGRGKFQAHDNYVTYMRFIVGHPNYKGMPNAIDPSSQRINWQVSSGKTTSFYKYYLARSEWWTQKADELNLKGRGNSNSRFSLAARMIHPTGFRPCRLCGNELNVGYLYINDLLARRWNKLAGKHVLFRKSQNVVEVSQEMVRLIGNVKFKKELLHLFAEKVQIDGKSLLEDDFERFFLNTAHIKSIYLSPGFMANPPDRLDGFHDYGICCRKKSDPGRHDENMRTYNHDRRAFRWWAEGDWIVADALYNKAGSGECSKCHKTVKKISPDHVGPLACGFKHLPLFEPLCSSCNSAKNRRFDYSDVSILIQFEESKGESAASWQVRSLWDNTKYHIANDNQAKELGNLMRSLQDVYLRTLYSLFENRMSLPLSYLLAPENAYYTVEFSNLDTKSFKYSSYTKDEIKSNNRISMSSRVVRIAFEELYLYNHKKERDRKVPALNVKLPPLSTRIHSLVEEYQDKEPIDKWDYVLRTQDADIKTTENQLQDLLNESYFTQKNAYKDFHTELKKYFDSLGQTIANEFLKRIKA